MTDGPSPYLELNNGVKMPALGLGVFLSSQEQTAEAVRTAMENGYRLVDTAATYHNERQVGEGLRQSGVDRDEVFITTKLWMSDYGYESALRAFGKSLRKLGLDYLDLYLLHWPVPSEYDATVASYKAMEKLLADGLVRAIGVSNHSARHLETLMARTDVAPAVNQVELHPYFIQRELREVHARLGIVTQSWSPIGGVVARSGQTGRGRANLLEEPVLAGLAARYGKTPAQIVLRWHIDHDLCAIPKSVRAHRIAENIGIFDFALAPSDMAAIDGLDAGVRASADPETVDAKTFGIEIEE